MLWLLVNIRFQVLFHSPPGVLFTFPSRYCFTIGHQVVFRLGGWSPLLPTGFHVSGGTLDPARCSFVSFTGLLPSLACLPMQFYYKLAILNAVLNPKGITTYGLASSPFARRYLGNLFWFLFLRLLRCFSSAGLPPYDYFIHHTVVEYCSTGFPHSEIHGSMDICSSPWLIAACHVLLRLLMPRHSSYALSSLTFAESWPFLSASLSFALTVNFQLLHKKLRFSWALLLPTFVGLLSTFSLNNLSFSLSFLYVSKSFLLSFLDTFASFLTLFSYPFLFEKTFSFLSYSFFFIQFSNIVRTRFLALFLSKLSPSSAVPPLPKKLPFFGSPVLPWDGLRGQAFLMLEK